MRSIFNFILLATGLSFLLTACDKADTLPLYTKGNSPSLSSSTTTIAVAPADSDKVALTLGWTSPNYATDPSNVKYVVEIDSMGRNFSKAATKVVVGQSGTSFTGKELNNILLGFGFAYNVPYYVDVRVTSSYVNNNEPYRSNTITMKMTPYKIPPKIAPPTSGKLFLVGSASQGGWNNPVPVPTQQFTQIDATTYGGIFQLNGNQEYLVLPVNGDWSNKYSVANKSVAGLRTGGNFGYNLNDNFPGPTTSGWYKIILDFQTGKFTVTPYTGTFTGNLFIVGDATAGGWNNPVPVPSQQFTQLTSGEFQLTIPLNGTKSYLFLPTNGDWGHKFGGTGKAGGILLADGDVPGSNTPAPDANGTYKIYVNFLTNKYTVGP